MNTVSCCRVTLTLVVFLLCFQTAFCAEPYSGGFAQDVSDSLFPFVALCQGAIYLDGRDGRNAAVQGLKALVVTDLTASMLKAASTRSRPNRDSLNSFPSRHAAASFAAATIVSEYDSSWSIPAYTAAALVGWSRVELREHYWRDVVAGAALGYFVARAFAKDSTPSSSKGLGVSFSW